VTAATSVAVVLAATLGATDRPAACVGDTVVGLAAVDVRCAIVCETLRAAIVDAKWAGADALVDAALLHGAAPEPPPVAEADVDRYLAEHAGDFHGPHARDRAAVRFFLARERARWLAAERAAAARLRTPPRWSMSHGDPALGELRDPAAPVADVGTATVRNGDVERRLALSLYRLRGELARERLHALDELVEEILWSVEASARGTDPERLRASIQAEAPPVTDADVARYLAAEGRAGDPAARPERIRPYLAFRARRAAEERFLADARARRGVTVFLREPAPPRLALGPGAGGWHGPAGAAVRIVFLSSYRGSVARAMWPIVRALAAEPDIALAVRPLLPQWDPEATGAAAAVRCAGDRSLAMHEAVLGAPEPPGRAGLDAIAAALGVANASFATCLDDPATAAAVVAESAEAEALGIEPPAVVIDGRVFGGMQGAGRLRAVARRARRKTTRPASSSGDAPVPSGRGAGT
jgi:2-hydroxychromene-2-carboxylate isomerase